MTAAQSLHRLEALRHEFGGGIAATKLALLTVLARGRLGHPDGVLRLHEQLCFMRAYPDDRRVLAKVNAILITFAQRSDLKRHRLELADNGIAGTRIHYRFYWPTAKRLAARWPAHFHIDWDCVEEPDRLAQVLPMITSAVEAAWLRGRGPEPRAALRRLAGAKTTDAAFLVQGMQAMAGDDFSHEASFDALDTPFVLHPGAGTPSRTLARHATSPVAFVRAPVLRARQDLPVELRRAPQSVRKVPIAEGAQLIELALSALVTRSRDIDGIAYADPGDVWMVDDGDALQWAFFGLAPERRQLLRASHGFLTLRSGVPIGYGQFDTLFRTADVSFNSFDTFRGPSTAKIFVRLLAAARALLGACAFTLDGYQIGHHNEEAIASGAWWFYYKLGFRPRNAAIRKLAAVELARMQANPKRLSSPATLRRLAADTLYFESDGVRAPLWPLLADIGAAAADRLAMLGVVDREAAVQVCSNRVMQKLGISSLAGLPGRKADVALAWRRWVPVVDLLKISAWSAPERRSLAAVIDAKGGHSEREFLQKFDAHPRIAGALRALCGA